MYDPLHKALNSVLKTLDSPFTAVQTHNSSLFPADLSCSQYGDERLLHGLSFFLEWKARGVKLDSPEHCGQLVDYFNQVQSVQRYRSTFISVLSNYDSAWIFIASYAKDGAISVTKRPAASLADAILYANRHSAQQVSDRIPKLDRRIAPPDNQYEILDASRRSFLLSLDMPPPGPHVGRESGAWRAPTRHTGDKFVVKIRHDGDVEAIRLEIKVLLKLRDSKVTSLHVPELVWAPRVEPQYGITPLGRVINFRQSGRISRRIVEGLLDGLEYLHGQGIVHRDIRPSNLVLDKVDNVIIIDYETAETIPSPREVEYFGGYICWPPRLLESESPVYRPDASDDLLASILVVLHLLFPSQFDTFRVTNIRPGTEQKYRTAETAKLLELWKTVKESAVWGRFVVAAARKRYGELREMSQVFCHI
jgi:predicted Ser/Thr protein kinase